MSKVVVSCLTALVVLLAIAFLTWTVLSFTYYESPASTKGQNGQSPRSSDPATTPPRQSNSQRGNYSEVSSFFPLTPTPAAPRPTPPSPRREFIVPYKLPPDPNTEFPESDTDKESLWFDEKVLRTTPNRFGTTTSSSSSSNAATSSRTNSAGRLSPPHSTPKTHYDSGQFRYQAAPIWDPHPQYKWMAFGQMFHLMLSPADDFVSPTLRVTTHESNYTWRDDPDLSSVGNKCFYRGYLSDDPDSSVAVSLCHGMTGHIRTSGGSFFIEPAGEWKGPHTPLRHVIYQIPPMAFVNHEDPHSSDHHHSNGLELNLGSANLTHHPEINSDEEDNRAHRRRKRSMSKERYVELMVVTDSTMTAYHGDNLKHYVLTLLSIVALVYKDASIGNPVNIALVKFHILRDKDFAWKSSDHHHRPRASTESTAFGISASEMLRNFCKWQKEHNNMDDASAQHHDTALLLTRETICRNPWLHKCDTLGLAELGTMCDHYASCAIVQDNGLSAAFTIAHELGHVMNMPHDDDTKCQTFASRQTSIAPHAHYVMSRMLDHNTYPWAWSRCSRHYLTEFLDAGHGYCLEDTPQSNMLDTEPNTVSGNGRPQPGEIFSENRQCQLVFGAQSQLCSYMPVCRRLWCTTGESGEEEGCRTQHMPWADGTPCSRDKWCQRGICVPRDLEKLRMVDGGWGSWQKFGECSRTCGGGVRRSIRECDNPLPSNGGKYCIGPRIRYEPCNAHECSAEHKDFRAEQCGEFNEDNFNIQGLPKDVQWVPKYAGISTKDRCKLFCRVLGSSAYYLLKEKVIDGTQCGPETFHICVNGACLPAGCDRRLHSPKELDMCGICGGDNSTCMTQDAFYNETKYGYSTVVRIPAGSSSVDIRQRGHNNTARDDNYLAIMDPSTGEYVLNGGFIVSMFRKTVQAAGTVLEYSGSDSIVERINSSRPLKSDLIIQVLSVGKLNPPDIRYQYVISVDEKTTYQWSLSDRWTTCSELCHGTHYREPICLKNRNQEVDKRYCPGSPPVTTPTACNDDCTLVWKSIDSSPCSVTCGVGKRDLIIRCVREFSSGNDSVVSDSFCDPSTKLQDSESCTEVCNKAKWRYSAWSDCSTPCGEGTQSRKSACVDSFDNDVDSRHCLRLGEPYTSKSCANNGPCGKWRIDHWSPCSSSCGSGISRALYACHQAHPGGSILPANFCYLESKPVAERECEGPPCVKWEAGDWSSCSTTCGQGHATRRVVCVEDPSKGLVNDSYCELNSLLKPEHRRSCSIRECPTTTTEPPVSTSEYDRSIMRYSPPDGNYRRVTSPEAIYKTSKYSHADLDNSIDAFDFPQNSPLIQGQNTEWRADSWSECFTDYTGKRIRQRRVSCVSDNAVIDDLMCQGHKPSSTHECRNPSFWWTGNWDACNATCGQGFETRQVHCLSEPHRHRLPETECPGEIPDHRRPCNVTCTENIRPRTHRGFGSTAKWRTGSWGKCSQACGVGTKLRQVVCQYPNGTSSNDCDLEAKPDMSSNCASDPCPIWNTGAWSECTAECGGGVQERRIQCRDRHGHNSPEYACNIALKPNSTQRCNTEPCSQENETKFTARYRWTVGQWTECSKSCGKGTRRRQVDCVQVTYGLQTMEAVVNNSLCQKIARPKVERGCARFPCPYQWVASQWTECDKPNGGYGIQQRVVTCHKVNKFGWVDPDPLPSGCETMEKPKEYSYCYLSESKEALYRWYTEAWSTCPTNKCGKQHRQKRRVFCARKSTGSRVGGHFCPKDHKPNRKRKCPIKPCYPTTCQELQQVNVQARADGEYILFVGGTNITMYCHNMNTDNPTEYLTLPEENFSEIYAKRLIRPDTCPKNGARMETCECIEDSNRISGYTIFNKIRVNVTNLRVDTEDFTFTQQVSGSQIGYGQSGDCYSSSSCPQGRFSINLEGTRLQVSPSSTWVSHGHRTAMWISKTQDNVKVTAKCGGYCGTCSPHRLTGLKLQVGVT